MRKNIKRIENENQQLLKRISEVSPTYKNSQMRQDRQKQVKLLKLKGKYPYEERHTELMPSLNHSGSQSVNGRFHTISSRTHANDSSLQLQTMPINEEHSKGLMASPEAVSRREYIERYENYLREQEMYAHLPN